MVTDLHRCDEALRQVERAEELLIYSGDRSNRCRYRVEALTGAATAYGSADGHLQHVRLPCPKNRDFSALRVRRLEQRFKDAEQGVLYDCFPISTQR